LYEQVATPPAQNELKRELMIWRTKMQGRVVRGLTQVSEGASVGVGSHTVAPKLGVE
jgi:hypothetical protein